MNLDIWKELERKDELTNCEECGKKMWIFWHTDSNMVTGGMRRCAPCHFKTTRNSNEEN